MERRGERLTLPITPAPSPKDGAGRIGIQLTSNNEVLRKVAANPLQAVSLAGEECAQLTGTVLKGARRGCHACLLPACSARPLPHVGVLAARAASRPQPGNPVGSSSPTALFALPCPVSPAGLWQFITNFSATVDNVSGPVAILAVGAEVARSNSAGLYQVGGARWGLPRPAACLGGRGWVEG